LDGALRQYFLQFSRGHQAASECQRAENYFHAENGHHERRDGWRANMKFRRADECHAQCAEGVTQRGSLRDRGHGDFAQWDAHDGAEHESGN
jgi:hypothetical protein